MPRYPKGILGVRKDPRNQVLFSFSATQGNEWPSDDEEDSDYNPQKGSDSEYEGTSTSQKTQKRKIKNTKKKTPPKKKTKSSDKKTGEMTTSQRNTNRCQNYPVCHGDVPSLPTEIWEKIFKFIVKKDGALPFLERASRVCRLWKDISKRPHLWEKVDMTFGWINFKEAALKSVCANRLGLCQELNVSGCKFMNHPWGVQAITDHCHNLRAINLSNCNKLPTGSVDNIVSSCKLLQDIDLSSTTVDAVSQQTLCSIAEKCGTNLRKIIISENFAKNLSNFLTKLMENCPNLEHLDISNIKWPSGHNYDIEMFQRKCPKLKSFFSSMNAARSLQNSQQVMEESPGFPNLEELSLATLDSNRITTIGFVKRFLKNAKKLRLLDVRGCIGHGVVDTLTQIDACDVEQLYLARSQAASCFVLEELLCKWRHSLTHLDMSWNTFSQDTLDSALNEMCNYDGELRIIHLNLAGTNVHMDTIKKVLRKMSKLERLDLSSCRDLDRGCKREYKFPAEVQDLRKSLRL